MKNIRENPIKISENPRFLYLFFFLSGFSALVYQIIWMRKLALVFGHSAYATSATVSIFFTGLAIGSWLAGRILTIIRKPTPPCLAGRQANLPFVKGEGLNLFSFIKGILAQFSPSLIKRGLGGVGGQSFGFRILNLYSLIEFLIGLTALSTLLLIPFISTLPSPPTISVLSIVITLIYSTVVLLLPSVLIGMTFPVMVNIIPNVALVYGVNTLGATLGAFFTGFFLIANFGINQTLVLACGINIAIGLLVCPLAKRLSLDSFSVKSAINFYNNYNGYNNYKNKKEKSYLRLVPPALFLSGFLSLALEILLTRSLLLSFGSSTYAFSTILTAFLAGIGLGSFLAASIIKRIKNQYLWFSVIFIITALLLLIVIYVLGNMPLIFLSLIKDKISFLSIQTVIFALAFVIVSSITVLMGISFPLGISIYLKNNQSISNVANLYTLNTIGGIAGSLIVGFILISLLGVEKSFLAVSIAYILLGVALLWPVVKGRKYKLIIAFITISFIFIINKIPKWNSKIITLGSFIYKNQLASQNPDQLRSQIVNRKLIFYKDGLSSNVSVIKENEELTLKINTKAEASLIDDLTTELLIGHLPMFYSNKPENVLVIGYGAGFSVGATTTYPAKSIDVVEIEPAVITASRFFKEYNGDPLSDPRVNLAINDGRNYLGKTSQKYQVIASEPSNPWISGIANLFTREFFQSARDHLTDDGIMLQWVQYYNLAPSDLKSIIRTFNEVFPHVNAWTSLYTNDLLLIGTVKEQNLTIDQVTEKLKIKKVTDDLARIGIHSAPELFRHFLAGTEELSALTGEAIIHTDNYPFLEFSAPKSLWSNNSDENLRVLFANRSKQLHAQGPVYTEHSERALNSQLLIRDSLFSAAILENSDLDKSIDFVKEALILAPKVPQISNLLSTLYYSRAQQYFIDQKINEAKKYLEKSIEYNPKHSTARLNLAALYLLNADEIELAKIQLDEVAKLAPDRPELYIHLATYYENNNQLEKSKEAIQKALSLDPHNSVALMMKEKLR